MTAPVKLQFADLEAVRPRHAGRPLSAAVLAAADPRQGAEAGEAKPVEMLGEKFTVYRGASGEAHVVEYRCAHRACPLSLGWVEGDAIRCRYHGWKYDASGQCVEQPAEERSVRAPHQDQHLSVARILRADLRLSSARARAPAFRTYPDFDKPGVIVTDPPEILPVTFWNKLDNDHAHVPWVHRATAIRKGRDDYLVIRKEVVEETEYRLEEPPPRWPGRSRRSPRSRISSCRTRGSSGRARAPRVSRAATCSTPR